MSDILIQFHALPEELEPLVHDAIAQGLHATVLHAAPARAAGLAAGRVVDVLRDTSLRTIAFTIEPTAAAAHTIAAFLVSEPDALTLDVGHRTQRGLEESCLSARTGNARALEAWRRFARRLRAGTRAGAIAVDPRTGATSFVRAHRFTAAAEALDKQGVPILPVAGTARLHLGAAPG